MAPGEAREFLKDPANREVVVQELKKVCRERPEWWLTFLRKEERIRSGTSWAAAMGRRSWHEHDD